MAAYWQGSFFVCTQRARCIQRVTNQPRAWMIGIILMPRAPLGLDGDTLTTPTPRLRTQQYSMMAQTNRMDRYNHERKTQPRRFRHDNASSPLRNETIVGDIPVNGEGVSVGQSAVVHRIFTRHDVEQFAKLSGDSNPLHRYNDLEHDHPLITMENENEKKIVVHGMLVSSLFSCIFGTLIPGSVYLKQNLEFRKPVYVNDEIIGEVTITRIRKLRKKGLIVTCNTRVLSGSIDNSEEHSKESNHIEYVRGTADVWLFDAVEKEMNAADYVTENR